MTTDLFQYIRIESRREDGSWQGDPPAGELDSPIRTMLYGMPLERGDSIEVRIQGKWVRARFLGPEARSMNHRVQLELSVDGTDEEAYLEMSLRSMTRWPKNAA